MKLLRFRVTDFRSVKDSGWIDTSDITALIGENESGKTNLLTPLWKLNPANDEPIDVLSDSPRNRYNEIRGMTTKPVFIQAEFELSEALVQQLVRQTGVTADNLRVASVSRRLDGEYSVGFPKAHMTREISRAELSTLLQSAHDEIIAIDTKTVTEASFKEEVLSILSQVLQGIADLPEQVSAAELQSTREVLTTETERAPKRSLVAPRYGALTDTLDTWYEEITRHHPQDVLEARKLILNHLPKFVYYSDYGNLDSEIYLPHVIRNMERTDLGVKEHAKARTLKVLFDFVKLRPQEILELGQEPDKAQGEPSLAQIEQMAKRKKEREILLTSASTDLTGKFREWWQQGDYRFRFQADGNHFRIWVSDDRRPEEVELEGRSRGLQWFFSFYLVFLVESSQDHKNAILLLDEPGLSLHPIAQEDLSRFFENLASTNQLLYTTHSPFLVDPNHLDRVKAVYVDTHGKTSVSANLRANEGATGRSIYPVHAALNLSISRTYLQGCVPVLVEGPSDQIYLSAIKIKLISEGRLKPQRELVFLPVGGAKGVSPVVSIIVGRDESLPYAVLDSDNMGLETAKTLRGNLYRESPSLIVNVDAVTGRQGDEVEDLFPIETMARLLSKRLPRTSEDFDDVFDRTSPFVPQVKSFAQRHSLILPDSWKVDLATAVKDRLLQGRDSITSDTLQKWELLFSKFTPQ